MGYQVDWPPNLTSLQRDQIVQGATWSQQAYTLSDADCASCDASCRLFSPPMSQGSLVIAVRGTHTLLDALCDLEVNQVPLDDDTDQAMVHAGFHRQFIGLRSIIDKRVMDHLRTGGTLMCTGHSLGAGVASLFAGYYGRRFPGHGQASFCGYGTPRSGNAAFAALVEQSTSMAVCVRNQRDPVCSSIPPLACYRHAGDEVNIGHDPSPDVPDVLCIRRIRYH